MENELLKECRLLHSNSETCRLNIPGSSFQSTTNRGFVRHWGGIHLFGETYGPIRRGCCSSSVYSAEVHAAGVLLFIRFRTSSSTPVYAPSLLLSIISLLLYLSFPFPSTSSSTSSSSSCTYYSLPSSSLPSSVTYGLVQTELFRIRKTDSLKQPPHLIRPFSHSTPEYTATPYFYNGSEKESYFLTKLNVPFSSEGCKRKTIMFILKDQKVWRPSFLTSSAYLLIELIAS
jgi:hypothetical protein